MDIRVEPVSSEDQLALTFPAFQEAVRSGKALTACAWASGDAIGLAAAERKEGADEATLLSVAVKPAWRGRGVGSKLLEAIEDELRRLGCRKADLTYMSGNPSTPAVERMLARAQWDPPRPRLMICYTTIDRVAQGRWIATPLPAAPGVNVFSWRDLSALERDQVASDPRVPEGLSPFRDENKIEGAISVGLRKNGEVAGWFLTHRIAPDTVRYSTLYLRADAMSRGWGFGLVAEAIRRHAAGALARIAPNCCMDFSPGNVMMANFVRKKLLPTLTATRISMGASKSLR